MAASAARAGDGAREPRLPGTWSFHSDSGDCRIRIVESADFFGFFLRLGLGCIYGIVAAPCLALATAYRVVLRMWRRQPTG